MGIMNETVRAYAEEIAKEYAAEYRLEGKIETIRNKLKDNIPLETVLKCAGINREIFDKYANG